MYDFPVDILEKALYHYTVTSCYGEWDDDFYLQASYESFLDPALAACIIMDYIDDTCLPIYEENCKSFREFADKYKTTLDGGHPMGC